MPHDNVEKMVLAGLILSLVGWMVCIAIILNSCTPTNHYTRDSRPTLRVAGKGKWSNGYQVVYFSISNPTRKRIFKLVTCEPPNYPNGGVSVPVEVPPRSDGRAQITFFENGKYECFLQDDK